MTTDTAPRVYTIEEAAAILKVNPMTVRRLLTRGQIQGFRVGTAWRITEEALQMFMHGSAPLP